MRPLRPLPPVVAFDPGDEHVGVAWTSGDDRLVWAEELAATAAPHWLQAWLESRPVVAVVIEAFVLYPGEAYAQSWSPMLTSQMIGVLKWIAEQAGVPHVEQGADIKRPTRGNLRGRGIRQVGTGTHARDAELHLWYYLLRHGYTEGV